MIHGYLLAMGRSIWRFARHWVDQRGLRRAWRQFLALLRAPTPAPAALALLLVCGWTVPAQGSVVIAGTRVIYPGQAREKTLQVTNQDNFANVVQAWVDINDPASTPETADAPFLANPAVSRLAPGHGQTLRIIYTGAGLPQDRESLFHLNVLQIPPLNVAHGGRDQMLLMLRNRLKLFYRPQGIAGSPDQLPEKLRFSLVRSGGGWQVQVDNPTGFYASFGSAALQVGEHRLPLQASMVAPFGQAQWALATPAALPDGLLQLRVQLINDYGAQTGLSHELSR